MATFSLAKGIYLEDSKATLRWECPRAEAWRIGRPVRHLPNDDTRIRWKEHSLGGLRCELLAYLPGETPLEQVSVGLILDINSYRADDPLFQYCTLFNHFLKEIGTPLVQAAKGSLCAPILTWKYDDCFLQLITGERHGEFTIMEITKGKPPKL